jgi:hypothetical protein
MDAMVPDVPPVALESGRQPVAKKFQAMEQHFVWSNSNSGVCTHLIRNPSA